MSMLWTSFSCTPRPGVNRGQVKPKTCTCGKIATGRPRGYLWRPRRWLVVFIGGALTEGGTVYETKLVRIEHLGDVLQMLRVPRIERRVVPETISCQQVIGRYDQQLYADDPDSEVLVLGDSFLRIYQQDEPGSAGFIAHLAKELQRPLASIVNDGGASTLVRQQLYQRPALLTNTKVVVWEFVERDIRFGMEGWQIVPLPKRRE